MIRIEKYSKDLELDWNNFVAASRNATFLFNRSYMDYHADRFEDHSLMFYEEQKLVSCLPANLADDILYSHQGLTYGGLLVGRKMRATLILELFSELLQYLRQQNIKKFIYKPIPHFYSSIPSEEDLYALFRNQAQLFRRDISSVINLKDRIQFSELRRRMIKKAKSQKLQVRESQDFQSFYQILQNNLQSKYETSAVHSAAEIEELSLNFPDNIKLYGCFKDSEMLAATWVFINKNTIHLQYISNSDKGRKTGALDLIIDYLVNEKYRNWNYFDFGISTQEEGFLLNEGLVSQKEMFGGRAYCYDHYLLQL